MIDYPYIKTTAPLKEFLQKIPSLGSPASVSTRWLPKIGFKSANHRPIIRIIDFIGFIKSNKPTDRWRSYQVKGNSRRALADGIKYGYSELFDVYPDAHLRSDAELKNYFQKHLSASDQVITATIGTFKALCSLADFKRQKAKRANAQVTTPSPASQQQFDTGTGATLAAPTPAPSPTPTPEIPTLHTDIQIHIHPDADADQIREIFMNMAKYLYDKDID